MLVPDWLLTGLVHLNIVLIRWQLACDTPWTICRLTSGTSLACKSRYIYWNSFLQNKVKEILITVRIALFPSDDPTLNFKEWLGQSWLAGSKRERGDTRIFLPIFWTVLSFDVTQWINNTSNTPLMTSRPHPPWCTSPPCPVDFR